MGLPFLQATEEEVILRNKIEAEDRALQANDVSIQEDMVNAQAEDGQLTNRSIHEVEPIIEDQSIFNGGNTSSPGLIIQDGNPGLIIQDVAVPPQGDQVNPGPEGRRKATSCPPLFHGDIFNPKARPQSSRQGSEAESPIQSIAGSRFQKTKKKLCDQVEEIHTDALNE